jgi:hypothetical protein
MGVYPSSITTIQNELPENFDNPFIRGEYTNALVAGRAPSEGRVSYDVLSTKTNYSIFGAGKDGTLLPLRLSAGQ